MEIVIEFWEGHKELSSHVFPVPDEALGVSLIWKKPHTELRRGEDYFPIPHPKKVKKWRWWMDFDGIRVETAQSHSEIEMVEKNMQWHKISSSEIEVEE